LRTIVKIPNEWLTQRADDVPTSYQRNLKPGAALRTRMAWQKLKRDAQEGDEVWAFTSPSGTWSNKGQHAGYALVREGRIVESVVVDE
jgi:hypothetical protein